MMVTSCGYHFRKSVGLDPFPGVKRIFVPTMINRTPDTGAEIPLTNALIHELSATRRWKLVSSRKQADGVIQGEITSIGSSIAAHAKVQNLPSCEEAQELSVCLDQEGAVIDERLVVDDSSLFASQYRANLDVNLKVIRLSDDKVLFNKTFRRDQIFPAANRVGDGGTTNHLTNMSRAEISFEDMSGVLMSQAVSRMTEVF